MNLVELVKGQLGGDVVNRLGSMLGTSPDETRTAVNAAVPTLLAGLGQVVSSNDGAKKLASAVDGADTSMLGNLSQALSGNGQGLLNSGGSMLSSLFGGSMLGAVSSTLSKFTGLGSGAISTLLAFLAPTVLGLLKSKKTEMGLDAGGLGKLIAGQSQNITNAMPAGLGSMLSGIPGLGALSGLGGKAGEATDWARDQASNAYDAGRTAVRQGGRVAHNAAVGAASGAGSAMRWALPLLGLFALGLVLWWALSNRTPAVNTQAINPPARVTPEPRDVGLASAKIPGPEAIATLRDQVTGVYSSTTNAITSITDTASAEAALPKLREASTTLDSITTSFEAMPADARNQITPMIANSLGSLKPLLDKAMLIPGVSDRIKPVVDEIMRKTNALLGR